jgi:hypothetical protein
MKRVSTTSAVVVLSTAGCSPLSRQVNQTVQEQEAATVFAQLPTAQWGGYYSSVEPHEPTGGVSLVARAADDFTVERAISVSVVTWWGGSSDGYHHEIDTIDQVSTFLVEIFEHRRRNSIDRTDVAPRNLQPRSYSSRSHKSQDVRWQRRLSAHRTPSETLHCLPRTAVLVICVCIP